MLVYKFLPLAVLFTCNVILASQESDNFLPENLLPQENEHAKVKRSIFTSVTPEITYVVQVVQQRLSQLAFPEQCAYLTKVAEYLRSLQVQVCSARTPESEQNSLYVVQPQPVMPQPILPQPILPQPVIQPSSLIYSPPSETIRSTVYQPSYYPAPPPPPPLPPLPVVPQVQVEDTVYIIQPGIIHLPGVGNVPYKLYIIGEVNIDHPDQPYPMSITPDALFLQGILHIPSLNFWSQPFSLNGAVTGSSLQIDVPRLTLIITQVLRVQLSNLFSPGMPLRVLPDNHHIPLLGPLGPSPLGPLGPGPLSPFGPLGPGPLNPLNYYGSYGSVQSAGSSPVYSLQPGQPGRPFSVGTVGGSVGGVLGGGLSFGSSGQSAGLVGVSQGGSSGYLSSGVLGGSVVSSTRRVVGSASPLFGAVNGLSSVSSSSYTYPGSVTSRYIQAK